MHRLLFLEDRALIDKAHDAGADETMTYKQAGAFFRGTENRLKPADIQVYFKRKEDLSWHAVVLPEIAMVISCSLPVLRSSKT